ncbi:hypothetical protein HGRIS_006490 [Hohenbuehelia grisea]|uniref:RlpA-like protein double-psi beta-barrel domain-containing protein n=1 Tax=Hohenbuehelia grisea TaxID=104357 RepID=A0ABR3K1H3_9AGAR
MHLIKAVALATTIFLEVSAFTGRASFYDPNGVGACGIFNNPSDFVVAITPGHWANGAHCGRTVTVTSGGKTIQVKVVDECFTCPADGIDLSTGAFQQFASLSAGIIDNVVWNFA